MEQLISDIKERKYQRVYLLYGEEKYLCNQYKKKLRDSLCTEEDTMNYGYFEGKDTNPGAVIDLAETMPFFAEYRVILLENTGFLKGSCTEIAEYISQIPETTVMIFTESEVDKRSKVYKEIKKHGRAVEFSQQNQETLTRWILGILKKEDKKITQQTMQKFLTMAGTDMQHIKNELEKLISYTQNRSVITTEDVEAVCIVQTSNRIFEMVHAVAEGNQKRSLELYEDLLALKEPPMRILFLIARQFRQLYQVKKLAEDGVSNGEIAKYTGIMPFAVKRYLSEAGAFTGEELRDAMEDCISSEEAVKTGKMSDRLSVELLLVKYASRK